MTTLNNPSKQLVEEYFEALSGKPKTADLIERFASDPILKQHILETETAFPSYQLIAHQIVAEGDSVAVRATMRATHRGPLPGLPPTGRDVEAGAMLFYRIAGGRIAEHWMQFDSATLMAQLTA